MHAGTQGLGPQFVVLLTLRNEGGSAVHATRLVLQYDEEQYHAPSRQLALPLLVPLLQYEYRFDVTCLQPAAPPGAIRILLLDDAGTGGKAAAAAPLMTALLKMPVPELQEL